MWKRLKDVLPPPHSRIIVANQDKTWMGFLYVDEPWNHSIKVNFHGPDEKVLASYSSEVVWWCDVKDLQAME